MGNNFSLKCYWCTKFSTDEQQDVHSDSEVNAVADYFVPPRSEASSNSSPRSIVVALYDYQARDEEDLSFQKGDRMEVCDDPHGDWPRVVHLTTLQQGYVPGNYVAPEESVQSEDWFFENLSRREAEEYLLQEKEVGTFLVRPSEHNKQGYSISILDYENNKLQIKHYKILPLIRGGFCVSPNLSFATLSDLVKFYSEHSNGLCHVLTKPCKKRKPSMWDLSYAYITQWEIKKDEITLHTRLGGGNFGEVYYGKWKNAIDVAVKTLKKDTMSTEAFLQEAAIMKKFRHKKLVALYGVCTKEEPIYIVQEYMNGGSLLEFLREDARKTLGFQDLIYISYQVATGMAYLESEQLIHRDLAARNVLVGDNLVAKICDFGLARLIDNEYVPKQGTTFPIKWTAPEAIIYRKFSVKSDVWSYGILLFEIFTYGRTPYPARTAYEVIELVQSGYRIPRPMQLIPDDLYEIMLKCWNASPEKRPTFEFLVHYFEGYNAASENSYRNVEC